MHEDRKGEARRSHRDYPSGGIRLPFTGTRLCPYQCFALVFRVTEFLSQRRPTLPQSIPSLFNSHPYFSTFFQEIREVGGM